MHPIMSPLSIIRNALEPPGARAKDSHNGIKTKGKVEAIGHQRNRLRRNLGIG